MWSKRSLKCCPLHVSLDHCHENIKIRFKLPTHFPPSSYLRVCVRRTGLTTWTHNYKQKGEGHLTHTCLGRYHSFDLLHNSCPSLCVRRRRIILKRKASTHTHVGVIITRPRTLNCYNNSHLGRLCRLSSWFFFPPKRNWFWQAFQYNTTLWRQLYYHGVPVGFAAAKIGFRLPPCSPIYKINETFCRSEINLLEREFSCH